MNYNILESQKELEMIEKMNRERREWEMDDDDIV
jgi:hypothetical protein